MDGDWASPWADSHDHHPLSKEAIKGSAEAPTKESVVDDPWSSFGDSATWADSGDATWDDDGDDDFKGWGDASLGASKFENGKKEGLGSVEKDLPRVSVLGMDGWGWREVEDNQEVEEAPKKAGTLAAATTTYPVDDWGWGHEDNSKAETVDTIKVVEKPKDLSEPTKTPNTTTHFDDSDSWGAVNAMEEPVKDSIKPQKPEDVQEQQEGVETQVAEHLHPAIQETSNETEPSGEQPVEENQATLPAILAEKENLAVDEQHKEETTKLEEPENPTVPQDPPSPQPQFSLEVTGERAVSSPKLGIELPEQDVNDTDDDFGDFASGDEDEDLSDPPPPEEPDYAPKTKPDISPTSSPDTIRVTPIDIDLNLITKLYPVPTTVPEISPLEPEVIHTTEQRKTWYRLTQSGSIRMSNLADTSDYVQVTWPTSTVRSQVLEIVGRWIEEDRKNTSKRRLGFHRQSQNPAAMFGWGSNNSQASSPIDERKRFSLGVQKSSPLGTVQKTHSRHQSDMGVVNGSLTGPKSVVASPQALKFGWGSADSDVKNGITTALPSPRLPPITASPKTMTPMTPTTPGFSSVGSTSSSPRVATVSNRSSMSTTTTTTAETKPSTIASNGFDDWSAFKNTQQPSVSSGNTNTTSNDDWGMFESLVTSSTPLQKSNNIPPALDLSKTKSAMASPEAFNIPIPPPPSASASKSATFAVSTKPPVSAFVLSPSFPPPLSPTKPSTPTNAAPSLSASQHTTPMTSPATMISTTKPAMPLTASQPTVSPSTFTFPSPAPAAVAPLPNPITVAEDNDDDWGEMVDPTDDDSSPPPPEPIKPSMPTTTPYFPTLSSRPSTSSNNPLFTPPAPPPPSSRPPAFRQSSTPTPLTLVSNPPPFTTFPSLSLGWNTPPMSPQPAQISHSRQQSITSLPSHPTSTINPTPAPAPPPPTATSSSSTSNNWDLSFFDRPASTPPAPVHSGHSHPPPASTPADNAGGMSSSMFDLWDAAPTPVKQASIASGSFIERSPQAQRLGGEEERVVREIVEALPDLGYMLL